MGDFKVTKFTADIGAAGGYARANMFTVSFGTPAVISDRPSAVTGTSKDLLVKGAQFPGSTIAPMPVSYGGRITKLTGFRTFDNWTVTILNDESFAHRKWIQDWMYNIAGATSGDRSAIRKGTSATSDALYNNAVDCTVTGYNNQGAAVTTWNLVNCWPTVLGDITLDWSTDAIEEYTVEFAYEYWTHGHTDAFTATSTMSTTEVAVANKTSVVSTDSPT